MAGERAVKNERGHWEKDFGPVQQHTPSDCPKCLQVQLDKERVLRLATLDYSAVREAERDAAIGRGVDFWYALTGAGKRERYERGRAERLKKDLLVALGWNKQAEAREKALREALEPALTYIEGTVTAHAGETDREALNRVRAEILRVGRAAREGE